MIGIASSSIATRLDTRWLRRCGIAALLVVFAAPAGAQCVGDCNGNSSVSIDELIAGVDAALASDSSGCDQFDADDSGTVEIDELVTGIENSIEGCPQVATPTPTPTSTTGSSPTPTPTSPAGCGNGTTEPELGETCDDGNTVDGDNCPSTCRIRTCDPTDTLVDVDVLIAPEQAPGFFGSLTVFLRYPDGVISLPGSGTDPIDRFVLPPSFISQVNDLNYGARVISVDPGGIFLGETPASLFFTASFNLCQGAATPGAGDFACTVETAGDIDRNDVTAETSCSIVLP